MKTLRDEIWSLKIFFKYYFRKINLLKIFLFILSILLVIFGFFINSPWRIRIIILGVIVILIVLKKQFMIGEHLHLYYQETKQIIDKKLEERKETKENDQDTITK